MFDRLSRSLKKRLMECKSMLETYKTVGFKQRVCPACRKKVKAYTPFGIVLRKDAQCPHCGALERHRALWLYFENNTDLFTDRKPSDVSKKILHFAPERIFYDKFSNMAGIDYYPVDINPSVKGIRDVIDIQKIKYHDAMFDVIICSHVLEHVPNDREAMKELRRVLKEDGVAYINVPVQDIEMTFEDAAHNTPELRLKHYGQHDHVRVYGNDFPTRLMNAGFNVEIIELTKGINANDLFRYGLCGPKEKIYMCR